MELDTEQVTSNESVQTTGRSIPSRNGV